MRGMCGDSMDATRRRMSRHRSRRRARDAPPYGIRLNTVLASAASRSIRHIAASANGTYSSR